MQAAASEPEPRKSVKVKVTSGCKTRITPGEFYVAASTARSYCRKACVTAYSTSKAETISHVESRKKSVLKPLEPVDTGPSQTSSNEPKQDWGLNHDQSQD